MVSLAEIEIASRRVIARDRDAITALCLIVEKVSREVLHCSDRWWLTLFSLSCLHDAFSGAHLGDLAWHSLQMMRLRSLICIRYGCKISNSPAQSWVLAAWMLVAGRHWMYRLKVAHTVLHWIVARGEPRCWPTWLYDFTWKLRLWNHATLLVRRLSFSLPWLRIGHLQADCCVRWRVWTCTTLLHRLKLWYFEAVDIFSWFFVGAYHRYFFLWWVKMFSHSRFASCCWQVWLLRWRSGDVLL